ncbi:hypothetical protein [Roseateles sp. LYH14W]|uniref:TonB C-terminal domain-containing protein n=1 Tax=Pelomonas parva TaxID=3299032 RepID=A0ABW7F618_9BURK
MSASTFTPRSLFAGLALLTLAAAPALAQAQALERVEIHGRVVEATPRYDVHAACKGLDNQLASALTKAWLEEGRYGEVKVQLVLENGRVGAAEATGISRAVSRKVRAAMHRLDCAQQAAGTQVYRFSVDFIDPNATTIGETRTAARGFRING